VCKPKVEWNRTPRIVFLANRGELLVHFFYDRGCDHIISCCKSGALFLFIVMRQ
jgi:hypothetical protein